MVERIRQLIEYYNLNTRQFEEKISASSGQIYKYLSRGGGLNSDTLAKILEIFQQISPDWLILGKGEMLRKKEQEIPNINLLDMVSLDKYEKKVEECALLRAELAALRKSHESTNTQE